MRKRVGNKKVVSSRFINIAEHHKQLIIVIISIVAIIILSLFMFSKETTVGKVAEAPAVGDCVKSCQFKSFRDGTPVLVNVPLGETVFTLRASSGINIHVKNISDGVCNFDIYPSLGSDTPKINVSLSVGQYAYAYDNPNYDLELESIGCDSCVNTHLTELGNYPRFGEYYSNYSTDVFDRYVLIDLSFKPDFVVNDSGKFSRSCQDNITINNYVCQNGQPVNESIICSEGDTCFNGYCAELWDYNDGRSGWNVKNSEPDSYFWQELSSVCLGENTLVKATMSDNGPVFENKNCPQGCHFGNNGGWGADCFAGCTDTDNNEINIQGNVTGLVSEDYPGGIHYGTLKTLSDACTLDETEVIELSCDGDNIKETKYDCPNRHICVGGACKERPASLEASETGSRDSVQIKVLEDVTVPFFVIMTIFDENKSFLARSETKSPPLNKNNYQYFYVSNNNYDLIRSKEVIVYDTPDPSTWNVYLNATYVVEYNESE
jgi:hypothetical protein